MEKKEEETTEIKPEYVKRNLNSTLINGYDKLLFLAGSVHAMGATSNGLDEPDCMVLETYLMDIATDLQEGSKTLEGFDLVSK